MGNPDRAEERSDLDGYRPESNKSWADSKRADEDRLHNIEINILLGEGERASLVKGINNAMEELGHFENPSNLLRHNILILTKKALQCGDTATILSLQSQLNTCGRELNQVGLSFIDEDGLL